LRRAGDKTGQAPTAAIKPGWTGEYSIIQEVKFDRLNTSRQSTAREDAANQASSKS